MLGVLALFTAGLLLSPLGLMFSDNCCALDWRSDGLWWGDRQVVEEAALVKKAIV